MKVLNCVSRFRRSPIPFVAIWDLILFSQVGSSLLCPLKLATETDLRDQDDGDDAGDEVVDVCVEPDHVVIDGHEEDRSEEEDGQVGQLLGQEVDVGAVGARAVLANEDGDLDAEGLEFGMHFEGEHT